MIDRVPEGLFRCAACNEYRGRCRAGDLAWGPSDDDLAGLPPEFVEIAERYREALRPADDTVIEVACRCEGSPCRFCKANRVHRPGSNQYDPESNSIVHLPWFWGIQGCAACAERRRSGSAGGSSEEGASR